ncbi:hypothetical protein GCM10020000_60020 [Streptomyces olivoverticillatus]
MTSHDISRRTAVTAAATVTAAALLPLSAASAEGSGASSGPAFLHGVASGDPLPDGILLWTRVTPTPDAVPGSGRGGAVEVGWQVAEDADFARVVAHGTATATAAADHTVKADVRGLRPATGYFFRFTVARGNDAVHSPTGRTRTAPAHDAATAGLRFGVVSCANWESGWFSAYRHLAARRDLDAVFHLGDYIYEYKSGEYPALKYGVRKHSPSTRSSRWPTTGPGTARTRRTPTSRPCTTRTPSSPSGTTTSSPTTPGRAAPRTTRPAWRATGRTGWPPRSRRTSSGCRCAPRSRAPPTGGCASASSPTCT